MNLELPNNTDESSIYYTIVLFSPLLNNTCSRATVNSSSCDKKICRHIFYLQSLFCVNNTNLLVNVFACDESDKLLLHSGSVGKKQNFTTSSIILTVIIVHELHESIKLKKALVIIIILQYLL